MGLQPDSSGAFKPFVCGLGRPLSILRAKVADHDFNEILTWSKTTAHKGMV
jgi:hypothetical protein